MSKSLPRILQAAREYVKRGWSLVPIPRGEKGPHLTDWPNLRLTESDLPKHFSARENMGVILGEASGGLIDVDLDCKEALAVADSLLPTTPSVFGRASKLRAHRFYYCGETILSHKYSAPDGTCLVELRSKGQQTVVPPSIHPSGEVVTWTSDGEPAPMDGTALSRAVAKVAAAALLVINWPASDRHVARMALGGTLARADWPEEEAISFIQSVIKIAQPDDHEAYGKVAGDTRAAFSKLERSESVTGLTRLAKLVGPDVVSYRGLYPTIPTAGPTPR